MLTNCDTHDNFPPGSGLPSVLSQLPDAELWSVMERLQTTNATHYFTACRPERPKEHYTIDFSAPDALDYIPLTRTACLLSGNEILVRDAKLKLNPAQLPRQHLPAQHGYPRNLAPVPAPVRHGHLPSVP